MLMAFSRILAGNGSRAIGQMFLSSPGSAEGFYRSGSTSAYFHWSGKADKVMDELRTFVSSALMCLLPWLKTRWGHGSVGAPE